MSTTYNIGTRLELFVDDFLIDERRGVTRQLQHPQPAGRVLSFMDKPWEGRWSGAVTVIKDDDRYLMYWEGFPDWPRGKKYRCLCLAESRDGVHFTRPELGLFERDGSKVNNICADTIPDRRLVLLTPFLDTRPGVPEEERFKGVGGNYHAGGIHVFGSPDGIHWRLLKDEPVISLGPMDSHHAVFWSESEGCYVCYFRTWYLVNDRGQRGIMRRFDETGRKWFFEGVDDTGRTWSVEKTGDDLKSMGWRWVSRSTSEDFRHWSEPVELEAGDRPDEHIYTFLVHPYFRAPHLYVAPAARHFEGRRAITADEARRIDCPELWHNDCADAVLMTSRGGHRIDYRFREAFLRPRLGPQNWTSRTNYPALGIVPTGDGEMSMYANTHYLHASTGIERFALRTDGFVSVNASYAGGELVTKPLRFAGTRLVLNVATSAAGGIRVGVEDEGGTVIAGFGVDDCVEIVGNRIEQEVVWRGGPDVGALAGRPVRLRFVMKDADLFSLRFR